MLWEELRADQFKEAVERSGGLCIIPVGATEKHGPHLPLGTDCMVARYVARDAAKQEEAVVFEAFNYGQLLGFQHHPGSICLSTDLIINYFTELCSEIARNGFQKILLLSAHGGNGDILNVIAQKTQESKKDYVILTGNCYTRPVSELVQTIDEQGRNAFPELTDADMQVLRSYLEKPMENGHACFYETAAILGIRPELADVSLMNTENGESTHRFDHMWEHGLYSPYFWAGNWPNHYQNTYHPGINERIGRAMYSLNVERVAKMIKAIKEDEELLKINTEWNQKW